MKLTATEVKSFARQAHTADKKLSDGRGLYLLASKAGGRHWKLRAWINGRETTVTLGQWPEMGLAEAREAAQGDRSMAKSGTNPTQQKKELAQQKIAARENLMAEVAAEWFGDWTRKSRADGTVAHVKRCIGYLMADLGRIPVKEITPQDAFRVYEKIERKSGPGTAKKCLQILDSIGRRARKRGLIQHNPASDLAKDVDSPKYGNFAASLDQKQISAVLTAIGGYGGCKSVRGALLAAPYLAVRPSELVAMKWSDIHPVDGGHEWRFISKKKGVEHSVWLAPQVMEILKSAPRKGGWVFPGRLSGHVTRSALATALRRIGLGEIQTNHGWRATFRTLGAEELGFSLEQMEIQLTHSISSDPMKGAYARARYEKQRREMMQIWADFLHGLEKGQGTSTGESVVSIRAA